MSRLTLKIIEVLFRTLIVAAFICSTLTSILDTAASPLYAADDEQSPVSGDDSQDDSCRFSHPNTHDNHALQPVTTSHNELFRFSVTTSEISPTYVAQQARRDFIQTLRWWTNPP